MAFYKEVNGSCICDVKEGQEVRYYIPEYWFGCKAACPTGEFINLLGCFPYAIVDSKSGKPIGKLRNFKFPVSFLCKPFQIDKEKDLKLTSTTEVQDYRVLRFKKGDKLIVETRVPKMLENIEILFSLFVISGHIPPNIPYDELYEYLIDNTNLNGFSQKGIHNQQFGILISKICRSISDPSKVWRLSSERKSKDKTAYSSMSIKVIPRYTSTYTAITAEVFDDSLIQATQIKEDIPTPLERVLMTHPSEGSE